MKQDPLIGRTLANFRIEQRIGQGGMAAVYRGMDSQLDRPVAIKIINAIYQDEPEFARRFVEEAKMVARWRHENIISVYYADQDEGLYYFVMEYIDGATLEDLLTRYIQDGQLMPHADVIRIGRAVASALDYAHEQGVVHRDMKPSNVMISRDDRVVLMDFGLALDMGQGSMGQVFGTPHYISPEQARRSADAVPQSDVYGLGIILYEMLTGAIPFDDPSATAIAVQHMTQMPPLPTLLNPALNQQIEDVLLKALAKDPNERYSTATDLIEVLADALASITIDVENEQSLLLPPSAITAKGNTPQLSRMSISDMLAIELDEQTHVQTANNQATRQAPSPQKTQQSALNRTENTKQLRTKINPNSQPIHNTQPSKRQMGALVGLGSGLVVIIIVVLILFAMNFGNNDTPELVLVDATATDSVIATNTEAIEPSATNTLMPSDTATSLPSETATLVPAPTDDITGTSNAINATNEGIATSNAQQETILTQQANQATADAVVVVSDNPTVVFPNGNLLELTYNSAGFYLRNSSSETIRDSRLAFQAINSNGSGVSETFDGGDWARFYGNIDSNGRCVAIELLDQSSWNRPANCVAPSGAPFNSQLTFPTNDARIFWLAEDGASQFVVFWDNAEVARCQISDGFCQVRVGD